MEKPIEVNTQVVDTIIKDAVAHLKETYRDIDGKFGWHQYLGNDKIGNIANAQGLLILRYTHEDFNEKNKVVQTLRDSQFPSGDPSLFGGWSYVSNNSGIPNTEPTAWVLMGLFHECSNDDPTILKGIQWLVTNHNDSNRDLGWSTVKGERSRVYSTSLALRVLKKYNRNQEGVFKRGVAWLKAVRNVDGGWGEYEGKPSTAAHTAHALITLNECELQNSIYYKDGLNWLLRLENSKNYWLDPIKGGIIEQIEFRRANKHNRITQYHFSLPWVIYAILSSGQIADERAFIGLVHLIDEGHGGNWKHPHLINEKHTIWSKHDALLVLLYFKSLCFNWSKVSVVYCGKNGFVLRPDNANWLQRNWKLTKIHKYLMYIGFLGIAVMIAFYLKLTKQAENSLASVLGQQGYSVLNPANRLITPGTVVLLDEKHEGVLRTVCSCQGAFGKEISENIFSSPVPDHAVTRLVEGSFKINVSGLASIGFVQVKEIHLKLSNARILELSDEKALELFSNRSLPCKNAIELRKRQGKDLTVIKRVMQADATYDVKFDTELKEEFKDSLMKKLSYELTGRLSDNESNRIVGTELFWGFDDDSVLLNLQIDSLSSTGNPGEQKITRDGHLYQLSKEIVHYEIMPLKQGKKNDCWLTVYNMMVNWKNSKNYSKGEVLARLGEPWQTYYEKDSGLPEGEIERFLSIASLKPEPPANYLPLAYKELLEEYGPIWITTGNVFSAHARLLVGVEGNSQGDVSTLIFLDPANGRLQSKDFQVFFDEFEKEARLIVNNDLNIPLRLQILHF